MKCPGILGRARQIEIECFEISLEVDRKSTNLLSIDLKHHFEHTVTEQRLLTCIEVSFRRILNCIDYRPSYVRLR